MPPRTRLATPPPGANDLPDPDRPDPFLRFGRPAFDTSIVDGSTWFFSDLPPVASFEWAEEQPDGDVYSDDEGEEGSEGDNDNPTAPLKTHLSGVPVQLGPYNRPHSVGFGFLPLSAASQNTDARTAVMVIDNYRGIEPRSDAAESARANLLELSQSAQDAFKTLSGVNADGVYQFLDSYLDEDIAEASAIKSSLDQGRKSVASAIESRLGAKSRPDWIECRNRWQTAKWTEAFKDVGKDQNWQTGESSLNTNTEFSMLRPADAMSYFQFGSHAVSNSILDHPDDTRESLVLQWQ